MPVHAGMQQSNWAQAGRTGWLEASSAGGDLAGSRRSHSMVAPLLPTGGYNAQKWSLPLSGRWVVHYDRRTAIYQLC